MVGESQELPHLAERPKLGRSDIELKGEHFAARGHQIAGLADTHSGLLEIAWSRINRTHDDRRVKLGRPASDLGDGGKQAAALVAIGVDPAPLDADSRHRDTAGSDTSQKLVRGSAGF